VSYTGIDLQYQNTIWFSEEARSWGDPPCRSKKGTHLNLCSAILASKTLPLFEGVNRRNETFQNFGSLMQRATGTAASPACLSHSLSTFLLEKMSNAQVSSSTGVLSDGSNAEGCDPTPALGWTSTSQLTNVVVHGPRFSWGTTKVRCWLIYGGVSFTHETHMNDKPQGMKPNTPYQKIPVLDVDGRQVRWVYMCIYRCICVYVYMCICVYVYMCM
jgi:hypothetical protein